MTAVTIEDVWAVPDPIINHTFNLKIPNLAGGGDSKRLNVVCKSATLPGGGSIQPVEVDVHGHKLRFAGRREQEGSYSFTIVEGVDAQMRRDIQAAMNMARAMRSQQGALRSEYASTAYIEVLSGVDGEPIYTEALRYFWINTFNEVELGDGSAAVEYQVTASYDINEEVSGAGD
jgi:hypothetical protein